MYLVIDAVLPTLQLSIHISFYQLFFSNFRSVDFINLMAYDYHYWTAYLPFTGPNAPIYAAANDYNYFATLNANWSVHKWVDEGMPKEKIILGVPTYAHTYE